MRTNDSYESAAARGGIKTQVTDLSYDHDGQIGLKPNGAEGAYLGVAEPKGLSQLHLDILSP